MATSEGQLIADMTDLVVDRLEAWRAGSTLSKNERMSRSSTQSVFQQRARHTPTASSAERAGR